MSIRSAVSSRTVVFALAVVLSSSSAWGDDTRSCPLDPVTGVPLPLTVPGVCALASGPSIVIVQRTEEGLLIVEAEDGGSAVPSLHADGTYLIHLYDRAAQLIHCSAGLLDPVSGAPTPDCLLDLGTLAAGAGAHLGSGRTQASLLVGPSGAARCPTALHVVGTTTGREGHRERLTSSLVLAPTGARRQGSEAAWSACDVVVAEVRFAVGHSLDELGGLDTLDSATWNAVEELVRLNEAEWDVLRRLSGLAPDALSRLGQLAAEEGGAVISRDGRVLSAGASDAADGGTFVSSGILDDILAKLNTLVNRQQTHMNISSALQTTLNSRIPSNPPVVAMAQEVGSAAVVAQLVTLIDDNKTLLPGLLATLGELRQGFQSWEGGGCGPATDCGQFKEDLRGLFADLRGLTELAQELACLERPNGVVVPLHTGLVERLVIDTAPPVLLFALARFLDEVVSMSAGKPWQTITGDVLATIPGETRIELAGLCTSEEGPASGVEAVDHEALACHVLRPQGVGVALSHLKVHANVLTFLAKFLKESVTDGVSPVLGANFGAGGTVGMSFKNPARWTFGAWAEVLDFVFADRALAFRDSCLATDAAVEADLRSCSPAVSVFADGNAWERVDSVVGLRVQDVKDCQTAGGCAELCETQAECFLGEARARGASPVGYGLMCKAYASLVGGECSGSDKCCDEC